MTSPSQLKYLEAMGIPVWVSRELVIQAEISESKLVDEKSTIDTVNSILQDLEANNETTPKKPLSTSTSVKTSTQTEKDRNSNIDRDRKPDYNFDQSANNSINLLAQTTQHIIYAQGSMQAEWIVIGESPEFISDLRNQPFADEPGDLLDNMLKAVGYENPRKQAFFINVLKQTQQEEIDAHAITELNQLLLNTIHKIKPRIILVVGQLASQNLLRSDEPLARLRGKPQRLPDSDIPVVVTYYPSYLLSKPLDKRKAWEDLKLAMRLLDT
jgi:DNA polymerase